MTGIIDPLHQDHANLAKLLDALERQLGLFDQGETPDYDIVRGGGWTTASTIRASTTTPRRTWSWST